MYLTFFRGFYCHRSLLKIEIQLILKALRYLNSTLNLPVYIFVYPRSRHLPQLCQKVEFGYQFDEWQEYGNVASAFCFQSFNILSFRYQMDLKF